MQGRRKCGQCESYSYRLRKCLIGKANPATKRGVEATAALMGWLYICPWNPRLKQELDNIKLNYRREVA